MYQLSIELRQTGLTAVVEDENSIDHLADDGASAAKDLERRRWFRVVNSTKGESPGHLKIYVLAGTMQ